MNLLRMGMETTTIPSKNTLFQKLTPDWMRMLGAATGLSVVLSGCTANERPQPDVSAVPSSSAPATLVDCANFGRMPMNALKIPENSLHLGEPVPLQSGDALVGAIHRPGSTSLDPEFVWPTGAVRVTARRDLEPAIADGFAEWHNSLTIQGSNSHTGKPAEWQATVNDFNCDGLLDIQTDTSTWTVLSEPLSREVDSALARSYTSYRPSPTSAVR